MAKKSEDSLTYLQLPLPDGRKCYKMTKRSWSGLNYRQTIDTGALSMENNISTLEAPYLVPSQVRRYFTTGRLKYDNPISIFAFDEMLIVIYKVRNAAYAQGSATGVRDEVRLDYIIPKEKGSRADRLYTGLVSVDKETSSMDDDEYGEYTEKQRSVVSFNVYDTPTDPVTGQYIKKLLVFPDQASMRMKISDTDENPAEMSSEELSALKTDTLYCYKDGSTKRYYTIQTDNDTYRAVQSGTDNMFALDGMSVLVKEYTPTDDKETPPDTANRSYFYRNSKTSDVYRWVDDTSDSENSGWKVSTPPAMPDIKYAAVHLSRLFGVDDARVYASGYNDYANWNLDTVSEYNESNAWVSPAQSNTKADGIFTGIVNFQGHVICFKRDYMHEIYNTKNPFRIQDIFAEGAIDHRTIQDVDGRLIFVSEDGVKIYTGSNPRVIDYTLNIDGYEKAVSGTDGRCYYLYCEDKDENKRLLAYDTYVEQWSEQSIDREVLGFAHNKNGMYMLCDNGYIYKMDSGNYTHSWSFETDLITNETVDIKHIKKIQMLADIASGANLKVYILYDEEEFDEDTSHLVYESTGYGQRPVRVKPRKTAGYGIKLHVEGYGYVRLYELELFMENGGDLYV